MQNSLIISAVIAVIAVAIPVFLGSSRRRRDTDSSVNSSGEPGETDQIVEAARKLQEAYWSLDSDALTRLRAQSIEALAWEERLRLLHLICLEILSEGTGRQQLMSSGLEPMDLPEGEQSKVLAKLVTVLTAKDSPYRAQYVAVWQSEGGESDSREPDFQGNFMNASLTHLGCIEALRLDSNERPVEVCFVPLDHLRGVAFVGSAMFRYAKLFYDDEREDEIVLVPLLYGISWRTSNDFDRDGSFTRFICHLPSGSNGLSFSIGVGHQDFLVEGDDQILFGLGSVGELMIALSTDDPRFEEKCRARGLDPEEARQLMGKQ